MLFFFFIPQVRVTVFRRLVAADWVVLWGKERRTVRTTHGYGRSRSWTSFRPSGCYELKRCLLSPSSCERFLQVIPQGSYYWRQMWNPPHLLLSSDERKGLKYLSFWAGVFLCLLIFLFNKKLISCNL
jgi:hypothetical protein